MARPPRSKVPNSDIHSASDQPDEDDEDFFEGLPEWRLSDEKWQELLSIVTRAGGSAKKMEKLRGNLEAKIGFFVHEWPSLRAMGHSRDKAMVAEWSRISAAANALSVALEGQMGNAGLFGKHSPLADRHTAFSGKKRDAFLTQLEILREFTSSLANQKLRRSSRIDRHIFWQQLIGFWSASLGLEITSSESAPLLKFIRACSEMAALDRGIDALRLSDLDPENIRSFVRKWVAKRSH